MVAQLPVLAPQVRSLGLACSALEGCLEHPGISDAGVFALCALRQLSSLDLSGHCGITGVRGSTLSLQWTQDFVYIMKAGIHCSRHDALLAAKCSCEEM